MRALELFSGIGGLKLAAPPGLEVVAAYDQDRAAGLVHGAWHGIPVVPVDLSTIDARDLMRHEAEAWLLSPPCQPFTQRGRRRDVDDPRCAALLHLVRLLPECRPRRVLVENVPGFHGSRAHALLLEALRALGHDVRDLECCPTELGFPVRRRRQLVLSSADGLRVEPPPSAAAPRPLAEFLDHPADPGLRVPDDVRARVEDRLPEAGPDGVIGTFTRSYGRAISGAGPVLRSADGPRYFSPEEILRLHDFPPSLRFPPEIDRRAAWRLAGNSVHVGAIRRAALALAATLALATAGCRRGGEEPAPPRDAPAASAALDSGPDSCHECHAAEVEAWRRSPHRLASRSPLDAAQPSRADWGATPSIPGSTATWRLVAGSGSALPAVEAEDEGGALAPRPAALALGGRRREDFLSRHEGAWRVLPLSWSVVRAAWVAPVVEEAGRDPGADTAWHWTGARRDAGIACSRCHPIAAEAPQGVDCAACHDGVAHHAADARAARDAKRDLELPARTAAHEPLALCGRCHASGAQLPRGGDLSLTGMSMPATLASTLGPAPAFFRDGRPGNAHGFDVQGFAQSRCFREGGATCLTCHDPHGGAAPGTSLKDRDPDASCRACHAAIAQDAAGHAKHPVATSPVPLATEEPTGPRRDRLPGCVDCHAPALVPFERDGLARDHTFGSPEPLNAADFGIPDACTSCHPNRRAADLAAWLDGSFPDRSDARRRLALAFTHAAERGPTAAQELAGVVASEDFDSWTRASAAALLGALGPDAGAAAAPALTAVVNTEQDPVLVAAAARALGAVPGADAEELARLAERKRVDDWRVALAAATALDQRGDPRGAEELDRLAANAELPPQAGDEVDFELAVSLVRRGASKRAHALLLHLSKRLPERPAVWLNLGVACAGQGDDEGARRAWREVLALQPGDPMATANLATLAAKNQE